MLIPKRQRIADEKYLQSLRGKPCLVCGKPGEAHHLQRAEPRGMAQKTGDNWAVPVCHPHHMELHAFGDETTWWDVLGIDAVAYAKKSWRDYNGAE